MHGRMGIVVAGGPRRRNECSVEGLGAYGVRPSAQMLRWRSVEAPLPLGLARSDRAWSAAACCIEVLDM